MTRGRKAVLGTVALGWALVALAPGSVAAQGVQTTLTNLRKEMRQVVTAVEGARQDLLVVQRTQARTKATIEELHTTVQMVDAKLDEFNHRLRELAQRLDALEATGVLRRKTVAPSPPPTTPSEPLTSAPEAPPTPTTPPGPLARAPEVPPAPPTPPPAPKAHAPEAPSPPPTASPTPMARAPEASSAPPSPPPGEPEVVEPPPSAPAPLASEPTVKVEEEPPTPTPAAPPPAPVSPIVQETVEVALLDPRETFRTAHEDYIKGNYDLAIQGFRDYLKRHPGTDLASSAQYWLGECYFAKGAYDQAVGEFQELLDRYPKSPRVPSALFKQGQAYMKLGEADKARKALETLTSEFPATAEARHAAERLKGLAPPQGPTQ